ncbi:hypothetical protein DPEC_G00117560 [Dallia pectoralis]|uniref:Uncharacterized protein n=1 Tax=Dallia pectoralis TaxID=75939 RepID=A0ACC2GUQ2_DALPE|nr:hypothetical protein DPEC_G00117560 [Dallia pectoralis]
MLALDCRILTTAADTAGILSSWSAPVVTPPAAVDLEDTVIGGAISVAVCGHGVVAGLPFRQTDPLELSGQVTSVVHLGTGHCHKQDKNNSPHLVRTAGCTGLDEP